MSSGSAGAGDAPSLLARHAQSVNTYLRSLLGRYADAPPRLMEAVEYSLMAGGKRLRPALVLETAAACGTPDSASALAAAGAIELVHTFSLVHDDLPAMDNDDLRRGRPTSHKVFGEAMAILAGDAMVAMAFEAIAADADPAVAPALAAELAGATGPRGMIGGQVIDLASGGAAVTLEQLQALHRMKTGALLVASCRMGAIASGAPPEMLETVTTYARHLGLAFQIVDDLLDVTSTPEQLGKATRKDAARGKTTYPGLIGIDASRDEARRQLTDAIAALPRAAFQGLRRLAEFVVFRST